LRDACDCDALVATSVVGANEAGPMSAGAFLLVTHTAAIIMTIDRPAISPQDLARLFIGSYEITILSTEIK
jgi:hypothetical protein